MHRETIVGEFTHQAETFHRSAVANEPDLLERIVDLAAPTRDESWLDAACGPGAVARALAPHVGRVHGVDATPAMVQVASREAAAAGLGNLTVSLGDVTELALADESFDAAVTRFSLHHIPVPGRVMGELARVVRPGGRVVICDSVADADVEAFAFSQEIERLRDPSHWASLTRTGLHAVGAQAGLTLEREEVVEIEIAFEDWLARGSGHSNAPLIDRALAHAPAGMHHFTVRPGPHGRVLDYRIALTRWRR